MAIRVFLLPVEGGLVPGGGGHEEVDDELRGHLVLVLRRVDQLARAVAEVAGHLEIINQA